MASHRKLIACVHSYRYSNCWFFHCFYLCHKAHTKNNNADKHLNFTIIARTQNWKTKSNKTKNQIEIQATRQPSLSSSRKCKHSTLVATAAGRGLPSNPQTAAGLVLQAVRLGARGQVGVQLVGDFYLHGRWKVFGTSKTNFASVLFFSVNSFLSLTFASHLLPLAGQFHNGVVSQSTGHCQQSAVGSW